MTHPLHPAFFVVKLWSYFVPADFRSLYASLLESWLGVDGAPIIPTAPAARYALVT